jgi:hypothetical protein
MQSSPSRKVEGVAFIASEEVVGVRIADDPAKRRFRFTFHPTTGALVISPDQDLIIRKTLRREARRIQCSLLYQRLGLQLGYGALKARYLLLRVLRDTLGLLKEAGALIHHVHP